jgi:hypothetical protein
MKNIALVGSSGGNLYNQGGKEPPKMLGEIKTQAESAGIAFSDVVFVGANRSLDQKGPDTKARLYTIQDQGPLETGEELSLEDCNKLALEADKALAERIQAGQIDGLIVLSADPDKTNHESIKAAAEKKIPIVGTGGTSLGKVQNMGGRVVSASGTTGTTNRTRAVAFLSAFAKEFGLKYRPVIGSSGPGNEAQSGTVFSRINFRGIMMASMPGFIAMALVLAISKIPALSSLERSV